MTREPMDRLRQGHGGPPEPRAERASAEADLLTTLHDELAAVSPSPEFADRVRQRIAGDLPLLREELAAVEPSPEFKARVRQRIDAAADARTASWIRGWRWLVPTGAVAAALIAALLFGTRPKAPLPEVRSSQVEVRQAPIGSEPVRIPNSGPRILHKRTANTELRTPVSEPSLEVITNQPALLQELWERAANQAAFVSAVDVPEQVGQEDVVVVPIAVQPVVVQWLVEPPTSPGVLPLIWRIAAEMAERSVQ